MSSDEDSFYEVEEILDDKVYEDGVRHYFIKWKNYTEEYYNTWEPEDNLSCPDLLKQYLERCSKRRSGSPQRKKQRVSLSTKKRKKFKRPRTLLEVDSDDSDAPLLADEATLNGNNNNSSNDSSSKGEPSNAPLSTEDTQQSFLTKSVTTPLSNEKLKEMSNGKMARQPTSTKALTTSSYSATSISSTIAAATSTSAMSVRESPPPSSLSNLTEKAPASRTFRMELSDEESPEVRVGVKNDTKTKFTPTKSTVTSQPLAISAEKPRPKTLFGISKRLPPVTTSTITDLKDILTIIEGPANLQQQTSQPKSSESYLSRLHKQQGEEQLKELSPTYQSKHSRVDSHHKAETSEASRMHSKLPSPPTSSSSSTTSSSSVKPSPSSKVSSSSSHVSSSKRTHSSKGSPSRHHRSHQKISSSHKNQSQPSHNGVSETVVVKPALRQQYPPYTSSNLHSTMSTISQIPISPRSGSASPKALSSTVPQKQQVTLRSCLLKTTVNSAPFAVLLKDCFDPYALEKDALAFVKDTELSVETYVPFKRVQEICHKGNYCILEVSPTKAGYMNSSKLSNFLHLNQQGGVIRSRKRRTEVMVITGVFQRENDNWLLDQQHSDTLCAVYVKDIIPDFVQRNLPRPTGCHGLRISYSWKALARALSFPQELDDIIRQRGIVVEVHGKSVWSQMLQSALNASPALAFPSASSSPASAISNSISSSSSTSSMTITRKLLLVDRYGDELFNQSLKEQRFSADVRIYNFGVPSFSRILEPTVEVYPKSTGGFLTTDARNILLNPGVLDTMVNYAKANNSILQSGEWQVILHSSTLSHITRAQSGPLAKAAISRILFFMTENCLGVMEDWNEVPDDSRWKTTTLDWFDAIVRAHVEKLQGFFFVDNSPNITDLQQLYPAIDFISSQHLSL